MSISNQEIINKISKLDNRLAKIENNLYSDEMTGKMGTIEQTEQNNKLLTEILITVKTTKTFIKWAFSICAFVISPFIAAITSLLITK